MDPKIAGPSCVVSDIGVHAFTLIETVTGLEVKELLAVIKKPTEMIDKQVKEYEQQQEDRAALHRLVSLVSEEEAAQPSVSVQEPTGYDATLEGCVSLALDRQSISVGDIQRELKVGYTQAARWMDEMHHLGIVGPYQVEKPRDVLFTRENWPGLEELKKKARP